jgi:hypothetical protein
LGGAIVGFIDLTLVNDEGRGTRRRQRGKSTSGGRRSRCRGILLVEVAGEAGVFLDVVEAQLGAAAPAAD